jgi:sucrose phosphorylase
LCELIRLRNQHPAFAGQFECLESAEHLLSLRWVSKDQWIHLQVDLQARQAKVDMSTPDGGKTSLTL